MAILDWDSSVSKAYDERSVKPCRKKGKNHDPTKISRISSKDVPTSSTKNLWND
jgi:hypothetical protein